MLEFHADSKYLVFPISYHAQNKRLYFYIDNKIDYDIVFQLDYDKQDFFIKLNIERFYSKTDQIDG